MWSSPAGSICMQNSSIHVKRKYLGQNDDVFTREFLFQFTDNLLLDLLPWFELWEWNKDGNSLATRSNVEFAGVLEIIINFGLPKNYLNGYIRSCINFVLVIRIWNSYHFTKNSKEFILLKWIQDYMFDSPGQYLSVFFNHILIFINELTLK